VDEDVIGAGKPGEQTRAIMQAFTAYTHRLSAATT